MKKTGIRDAVYPVSGFMLDRLGILDAEGHSIDKNSFYTRKGINDPWIKIKQNNIKK
jgi:hypothetical protein